MPVKTRLQPITSLLLAAMSICVMAEEPPSGPPSTPDQRLAGQLAQSLESRGWAASVTADGTVYYLPPAATAVPSKQALADSLTDQLERQGWTSEQDADGNLIYRLRVPQTIAAADAPADNQGLAAQFRSELESRGWVATRVGGNLVYHPPGMPADETQPAGLAEQLEEQLQLGGWVAETLEDGSRVYRPSNDDTKTDDTVAEERTGLATQLREQLESRGWIATETEEGSVYYLPPAMNPEPPPTDLAEQLRMQLQDRGWSAETAADGSVIYRMATRDDGTAGLAGTGGESPAAQLREQLEARGWTAAPAADGSVLYLPPQALPPSAPTAPAPGPEIPAIQDDVDHSATSGTPISSRSSGHASTALASELVPQAASGNLSSKATSPDIVGGEEQANSTAAGGNVAMPAPDPIEDAAADSPGAGQSAPALVARSGSIGNRQQDTEAGGPAEVVRRQIHRTGPVWQMPTTPPRYVAPNPYWRRSPAYPSSHAQPWPPGYAPMYPHFGPRFNR